MNPWMKMPMSGSLKPPAQPRGAFPSNPFHMPQVPLGSLHPATTTFMPHTGQGAMGQTHPYQDTSAKIDQAKRELKTPWRSRPQGDTNDQG